MSTTELIIRATIAVLVLVDPFTRAVFFRILTEHEPERRREYVIKDHGRWQSFWAGRL